MNGVRVGVGVRALIALSLLLWAMIGWNTRKILAGRARNTAQHELVRTGKTALTHHDSGPAHHRALLKNRPSFFATHLV